MNGEKLKNLRIFYIIPLLYGFLHVAPMPVDAQELRFQIVIGGKQAVKKACQSSNYSKYHVVNGTSCAEFKPKKKKINQSVLDLQRLLTELGYDPGPTDGLAGKKTRNAAQKAFEDRGLSFSGRLDAASLKALRDADAKRVATHNEGVWFTEENAIQGCERGGCIIFYCGAESLQAKFEVPYEYAGKKWKNVDDELRSKQYATWLDNDASGILLPVQFFDHEVERILSANKLKITNIADAQNKREFDLTAIKSSLRELNSSCQVNRPAVHIPIDDNVQYSPYEEPYEYVKRVRELAIAKHLSTNSQDQCVMQQQASQRIFENLHINWSVESNTTINDLITVEWSDVNLPADVPSWLVFASDQAVRFEGNGIAISEKAVAPFGLDTGAGKQRFLIPLNVHDVEQQGSFKFKFLATGNVSVELSAVTFLPACWQEKELLLLSEKKQFEVEVDYPKITASSTIDVGGFEPVYQNHKLGRTIAYNDGTFLIKSQQFNSELNQINGSRLRISPNGRFVIIDRADDAALVDLVDGQVIGSLQNHQSLLWGWEDSILVATGYPHAATTIRFTQSDWAQQFEAVLHKLDGSLHASTTRLYVDIHNAMLAIGPGNDDIYTMASTLEIVQLGFDQRHYIGNPYKSPRLPIKPDEVSAKDLPKHFNLDNAVLPLTLPNGINIPQGYSRGVEIQLPEPSTSDQRSTKKPLPKQNLAEHLSRVGMSIQATNWLSPHSIYGNVKSPALKLLENKITNSPWQVEFTNHGWTRECQNYYQEGAIERHFVRSWFELTGEYDDTIILHTFCEGEILGGMILEEYLHFNLNDHQPQDFQNTVVVDGGQANGFKSSFATSVNSIGQSSDFLIFLATSRGSVGVYNLSTKAMKVFELEKFGHTLTGAHLSKNLEYLVTEHADGVFQIFELDFSNAFKTVKVYSDIPPVEALYTGRVVQGEIVVWNKYGYFDATADAASLIDVMFEGTDLQFSLDQFSDLLYVQNLIKTDNGEIEKQREKIPFPPQITGQIFSIDSRAKASFEFPRVENLDVLEVYQDGVLTQNEKLEPGANKWTGQFDLLPGVQTVAAVVKSTEGLSSRPLTFSLGKRETLPVVKSLAVAVDRYSDPALTDLNYAKADAARVLSSLKTISGKHIALIDNQFIGGRRATPDKVYDAVDKLVQEAAPHEHLVLFMAGHGLQSEDGDFYLALHSTDVKEIADTAVSFSRLFEALSTTSAKVTVLIDACHSGDAGTGIFATTDGALQNLGNIPSNVTILAAAKGRQESIESEQLQGGYFSVAFEDVISHSRATYDVNNNERIEATELQAGLYDFVTEKTNGKQTPWMTKGRIIGDFSLF